MKIDFDTSPFLMSEFWRPAASGSFQRLPPLALVPARLPQFGSSWFLFFQGKLALEKLPSA